MMTTTLPVHDLDELAHRSALVVDELTDRLQGSADIKRLREISVGGRLKLDAGIAGGRRRHLSPEEMRQILDRATFMLSSLYVHLGAKRALYAIDPLQALRNLRGQLGANPPRINEEQFHERLSAIFAGMRDCHTRYYLPAPYRQTLVFLPFLIEAAQGRYLVTKIAAEQSAADGVFRVPEEGEDPVVVTHVNGVPIKHVLARNGEDSAGSNLSAREARGVARLTFRWLGLGVGPREEWVDLRFTVGEESHERRFEWLAAQQPQWVSSSASYPPGISHDLEGHWIRDVKEKLYGKPARPEDSPWEWVRQVGRKLSSKPPALADTGWASDGHGIARYRTLPATNDTPEHGYLRIYTFDMRPALVTSFLARIEKILRDAPDGGLIVDIRGNPGGSALAAEGLLQLFTCRPVDGQGMQLLNTPEAITLARPILGTGFLDRPISEAQATGAPFVVFGEMPRVRSTQTVTRAQQAYQGPVVVIVDAGCYSASEMFAAGMQDHALAKIIGTHEQTGGGGGIVWSDESLAKLCKDPALRRKLAPLPGGAAFEVAVLRTTRVGDRVGVAVEDMGVVVFSEDVYNLTTEDVVGENAGLLARARETLAGTNPKPLVRATYARGTFTLRTRDLDRVEVYVDGIPVKTFTELDGPCKFDAPAIGSVEFRGVLHGRVVTSHVARRPRARAAVPATLAAKHREPPSQEPGAAR